EEAPIGREVAGGEGAEAAADGVAGGHLAHRERDRRGDDRADPEGEDRAGAGIADRLAGAEEEPGPERGAHGDHRHLAVPERAGEVPVRALGGGGLEGGHPTRVAGTRRPWDLHRDLPHAETWPPAPTRVRQEQDRKSVVEGRGGARG